MKNESFVSKKQHSARQSRYQNVYTIPEIEPQKYICRYCRLGCSSSYSLKRHEDNCREKNKRLLVNDDVSIPNEINIQNLKDLIKSCLTEKQQEEDATCDYCSRAFKTVKTKKNHQSHCPQRPPNTKKTIAATATSGALALVEKEDAKLSDCRVIIDKTPLLCLRCENPMNSVETYDNHYDTCVIEFYTKNPNRFDPVMTSIKKALTDVSPENLADESSIGMTSIKNTVQKNSPESETDKSSIHGNVLSHKIKNSNLKPLVY